MALKNVVVVGGGTAGWLTASILNRRLNTDNQRIINVTLIESKNLGRIGVGEATVPRLKEVLANLGIDEYEFMRRTNATFKHAIRYNNWLWNPSLGIRDYYYHPFENFQAERRDTPKRYYGEIDRTVYLSQCDVANYWWHRAQAGHAQPFAYEIGIQPYLCDAFRAPKTADMPSFASEVPYAYHLDAQLFADYLSEIGVRAGITHIVDDVTSVEMREDGGIASVRTKERGEITGDFFVDCTGFAGLLIGKALNVPLISYGQHLLCDRAVAIPCPPPGPELRPYTSATAADAGWIWEVDLTSRSGNGYVYRSEFISDDDAEAYLRRYLGPRSDGTNALRLKMPAGRRAEVWRKNCVAIGLAGGFVEPLESTGIMFIDIAANWLAEFFPVNGASQRAIARYNAIMKAQYEEIRDFIVLHYCISQRDDTPFWREVRKREHIPDSLAEKLELWREYMPRAIHMDDYLHIYNHRNYECILFGMGWKPDVKGGRQGVCQPSDSDQLIKVVQAAARRAATELPAHSEVLSNVQRRISAAHVSTGERKNWNPAALEPGVILVSHAAEYRRLKLSTGTCAVDEGQLGSAKYKAGARLPTDAWRTPTPNEYLTLTAPRRVGGLGAFISVFRIEPSFFEKFRAIGQTAAELPLYYDRPKFGGDTEREIELLVRQLGKAFSEPNSVYRGEGVTVNQPGNPTATYDLFDSRFPGLHFDSWSDLSPTKRDDAHNRMCINIGRQPRQLLFVNIPIRRMIEILSEYEENLDPNPTHIGRAFMSRFPDYPVVSVEVGPGEGYIAPTENIVHDGSTSSMTETDVTLTLLGRFLPIARKPILNEPIASEPPVSRPPLTEGDFAKKVGLAESS